MATGTKLGAVPTNQEGIAARKSALTSQFMRFGQSSRSFATLPGLQQGGTAIPPNRLEALTADEKNEVLSRDLKVCDPQAPKNLVRLKFNSNTFEEVLGMSEAVIINKETTGRIGPVNQLKMNERKDEGPEDTEEETEGEGKGEQVLRNQFNFCDRATQGSIIFTIEQGTLTEAPRPKDCTGVTNQREIAAAYAKDKQVTLHPAPHPAGTVTRVMERVVNQNLDPNACCDFRYFDDPRDAIAKDAGYTLPLWEFRSEILAGCGVSLIRWNPSVGDLFAASYGPITTANDKGVAQRGFVCTWTLKNQSTPRSIIELTAPALSLDWNPTQPALIVAGSSDGNMAIFNASTASPIPLFSTYKLPDRHASGVTVVRWQPPDNSGNQTLLSAGLDGRILIWTLIQNEMKVTEICQLPAGIVALDYFSEHSTHFRVACDDGKIYNVLRTRTTQAPTFYDAHSPPILGLSYNRFQSAVFASCGTDWALKIWREGETVPLQVYDYAPHYVTDCQFGPHSSTILGSVTSDGELFIYDIAVNRYREICKTEVVESGDGGLTALRFHPKWPVLLLGDEKGRVHAVKMSPNLRRNTKTIKDEEARNKLSKSSSRDSRGLLPDLANQQDDEDDAANAAAEEEARLEALSVDESNKFIQAMGVSWIHRPDVVSAIPAA
jgi:dynein intermediate chain 1